MINFSTMILHHLPMTFYTLLINVFLLNMDYYNVYFLNSDYKSILFIFQSKQLHLQNWCFWNKNNQETLYVEYHMYFHLYFIINLLYILVLLY